MFKHENIVELYDYFEDQQDITMLMEYCNDAKYFENKIENVSSEFHLSNQIAEKHTDKEWGQVEVLLDGHFSWLGIHS